jgi:hypothetical protein
VDVRAAILDVMPTATPLPGLEDAWHWQRAPGFDMSAALSLDGEYNLQFFALRSYDEKLVVATLSFAREHFDELRGALERPLVVVEGFHYPHPAFDVVVSVGPGLHRHYQQEKPELGARTISIFPAYRCEFAGDENESDAAYRWGRAAGVQTSVLDRQPRPFLKFRYKAESGRVIKTRGFAGVKSALIWIQMLERDPERFVELENYRHEVRRFEWADGHWLVSDPNEQLESADLREFLVRFLWGPNAVAGTSELDK